MPFAAAAVVACSLLPAISTADPAGPDLGAARLAVEQSALPDVQKRDLNAATERAVGAGIPPDDAAIIILRSLGQGAEAAAITGFLETASRLKERGLPVRLFLDRIEQGLAKGVPAGRIYQAVEKLSASLAAAGALVAGMQRTGSGTATGHPDTAVETVARAFEKSVPADAIVRTGEKVHDRKGSIALFSRAVDVMTAFVGSGMDAAQASLLVHTAVDRGYSERDLEAMERYMVDETRKNRPVQDIVSGLQSRMQRGAMRGGFERPMRGPGPGGTGSGSGIGGRR